MALTQSAVGTRAYSIGPVRQQRVAIQALSADTTGTLTFDNLIRVESVLITSLQVTAITYNGDNTCTITFTAPGATVVGIAEGHGP